MDATDKLAALIDRYGGAEKAELEAALNDIGRALVTQALLVRNLRMELENAMVGNLNIEESVVRGVLPAAYQAKRNPFTFGDARAASDELVRQAREASSFTEIFKGVFAVAKVLL